MNIKWMKDAKERLGELAPYIDPMVHASNVMAATKVKMVKPLCNAGYMGSIGWAFDETDEPVNCMRCIAEGG